VAVRGTISSLDCLFLSAPTPRRAVVGPTANPTTTGTDGADVMTK
jgi:hypothetical protein